MTVEIHFDTLVNPKRTPMKWTAGVTINPRISNGDSRFFFFEFDREHFQHVVPFIDEVSQELPLFVHGTGNGIHVMSLNTVTKKKWKELHAKYRHINPKCPMTTLRIIPNKYYDEMMCWLKGYIITKNNVKKLSQDELYQIYTTFADKCQLVKYPLP